MNYTGQSSSIIDQESKYLNSDRAQSPSQHKISTYKESSNKEQGQQQYKKDIANFSEHCIKYEREEQGNKHVRSIVLKQQTTEKEDNQSIENDQWKKLDEIIKRIKFKTYIKKFLLQSRTRLYRMLNFQQASMINDQATQFASHKMEGIQFPNLILQRVYLMLPIFIRKYLASFPIFQPNNPALEIWQYVKIVSVIVCFYFYLIAFAFNLALDSLVSNQLNYSCQSILAIDILVNLNTAIYLKGQLTTSRKQILHQYRVSKALYYDFAQLTSFFIYFLLYQTGYENSRSIQILLLPIIFKHNDLNIIIKKMKNKFLLQKETQNAIELVNLLKNIFLISHVFACIWIMTAKLSMFISSFNQVQGKDGSTSGYTNWLSLMSIDDASWSVQYLYSYYFITVTMITVGYGDIRPTNSLEVGVCIFLMMTCCFIFGFTINSIGQIFQDIFSKEKNILQKRCVIGNYMHRKDIHPSTQKSVFEYLEYYWREELDENSEETQKILNQLSSNLNQELMLQSNSLILKNNKILRDHFSQDLLIKCLPFIEEQNCTPGEVIVNDQIGNLDCCLYFIQFGDLEVFHHCTNNNTAKTSKVQQQIKPNTIKRLSKGNNFGQISFFTGEKESLSLRSLNFCTLLKLKRSDFIIALQEFSQEYETFCMIKDKILYSSYNIQLYDSCYACGEPTHTEQECPFIHFIPKNFKIIEQSQLSQPHLERNRAIRRRAAPKQNTIFFYEYNLSRLSEFIENKIEMVEEYEAKHFEFTLFRKTYNELDEISENQIVVSPPLLQQVSQQSQQVTPQLTAYQGKQFNKQTSSEKVYFSNISSDISDQQQNNEKNWRKKTFVKRYSILKNGLYNERSQEIDEHEEISSKNIQLSLVSEQDFEKEPINQQGASHRQSQPKIHHQRKSNFQNSPSNREINNINEVNNKIYKSQDQNSHFSSMRNQEMSSMQFKMNQEAQPVVLFDVFNGQFEHLFAFNSYFTKGNFKSVIQAINDWNYNKRADILQVYSKQNLIKNQRRRRNGQKLQAGVKISKPNQKFLNSNYINSPQYSQSKITSPQSLASQQVSQQNEDKNQNQHFRIELSEIKVYVESPQINEEQTHLRNEPVTNKFKKNNLSKRNSVSYTNSSEKNVFCLDHHIYQEDPNSFQIIQKEIL